MSEKSGQHIMGSAINANAIRKIIMKLLTGGWKAAAVEAAKQYWPYISGAVLAVLFLPIIIVFSLPSATGVSDKADLFSSYEQYVRERYDELALMSRVYPDAQIDVVGQCMSRNEMYAACLVLSDNNTEIIDEEYLLGCIEASVIYELDREEENTEISTFVIRYLDMEEFLESKGCTESDMEWAALISEDMNRREDENG